jgi:hypothetical protein
MLDLHDGMTCWLTLPFRCKIFIDFDTDNFEENERVAASPDAVALTVLS